MVPESLPLWREIGTHQIMWVVFLGGSKWKQEIMLSDVRYIFIYLYTLLLAANIHSHNFEDDFHMIFLYIPIGGMY